MERLTNDRHDCMEGFCSHIVCPLYDDCPALAKHNRLAEYEDIGLTPAEIKSLVAIDGALAMNTDAAAHKIFKALPPRRASGSICPHCGEVLQTAYHEERLYSVKCVRCQTVTLVKARNPGEAASKVGYQIKEDSL